MKYYDRKGQPIELMEWGGLLKDINYKRVGETDLPDGRRVSTVWLGLDHGFGGGEPLIFETMVFGRDSWSDLACERYATLAEAVAGHARIVAECEAGQHMPESPK